ncbi:hypothetical protein ACE1SV_34410 [Streptomyces sennicomposti]
MFSGSCGTDGPCDGGDRLADTAERGGETLQGLPTPLGLRLPNRDLGTCGAAVARGARRCAPGAVRAVGGAARCTVGAGGAVRVFGWARPAPGLPPAPPQWATARAMDPWCGCIGTPRAGSGPDRAPAGCRPAVA